MSDQNIITEEISSFGGGESKKFFSLRFVIAAILNVIILVWFVANAQFQLNTAVRGIEDIKREQKEQAHNNDEATSAIKTDIALMKVRLALIENYIEEQKLKAQEK